VATIVEDGSMNAQAAIGNLLISIEEEGASWNYFFGVQKVVPLTINSRLAFYCAFACSRNKQVSRTSKCHAENAPNTKKPHQKTCLLALTLG
jgi:hypothetical protein